MEVECNMKNIYEFLNNNYAKEYKCKYKDVNEVNNYKNISKTTNNDINIDIDIESELYRLDLLNIFKIKTYNDNNIASTLDCIYDHFIKNNHNPSVLKFKNIISKASQLFMSEDDKFGLTILYSYEYLNESHQCICELINTNNIDDKTVLTLEKLLE